MEANNKTLAIPRIRNWKIKSQAYNFNPLGAIQDQINWWKFGHVEIKIVPLRTPDKAGESLVYSSFLYVRTLTSFENAAAVD